MKNIKTIGILFFAVLLMIVLCFSTTYSWLFYEKKTSNIDISTGGVKYVYEIDGVKKLTSTTYSANDITFFDMNEIEETKYFHSMAKKVELEITNTGDYTCDVTVSSSNMNLETGVVCFFFDTVVDENTLDPSKSIKTLISEGVISQDILFELTEYNAIETSDTKTIYMYIIGYQEDANSNNDFLNDENNYLFTVEIKAVQK